MSTKRLKAKSVDSLSPSEPIVISSAIANALQLLKACRDWPYDDVETPWQQAVERNIKSLTRAKDLLAKGSPSEEGTGWIEIKESCEMPKDRQVVRVFGGGYQEVVVFRAKIPNGVNTWQTHHGSSVYDPAYWKPLDWPAPPVAPPIEEK